MVTKISTRIEFFMLDLFIYVLSESKFFQHLVRISYHLINDRRFLLEFVLVCFVSISVGLGIGYWISVAMENFF